MFKDEVWQQIKNEKTPIYGNETILSVFLATTNVLEMRHFLELDPKERNKLNGNAVYYLLVNAPTEETAKLLGAENISKLPTKRISELMTSSYIENPDEIANIIIQYKKELSEPDVYYLVRFVKNPDEIAKKIIKNRQLSGDNVYNLLRSAKNKEEIANLLGAENINKLSGRNIFHLIRDSFEVVKPIGSENINKLLGSENINKLSGYLVFELLRSAKDVEETAKLIGSENIRKLSDKNIYDLIHIAKNKDEMTQVINKYRAN